MNNLIDFFLDNSPKISLICTFYEQRTSICTNSLICLILEERTSIYKVGHVKKARYSLIQPSRMLNILQFSLSDA